MIIRNSSKLGKLLMETPICLLEMPICHSEVLELRDHTFKEPTTMEEPSKCRVLSGRNGCHEHSSKNQNDHDQEDVNDNGDDRDWLEHVFY